MIHYKPIEQQFNESARDIRNNMNNMPRLVIGKDKPNNLPMNYCPYCKRPFIQQLNIPIYQNKPQGNDKDKDYDKLYSNIRKWGIMIAISVVVGYAIYRLVFDLIL